MSVTIDYDQESGALTPAQGYGLQPMIFDSGKVSCDNNYPSGGYDVSTITGKFKSCKGIIFAMKNGYLMEFDDTNDKMIVKTPVSAVAAHTHTVSSAANQEIEEEAISSKTYERIYHGDVTGTFGVGNVVRGGTSNATGKIAAIGSGYLDLVVDEIGLDAVYDLTSELLTDYIAHCAMLSSHIAADSVNNDPTALAGRTWAACYASLNSLKAKYNAHDAESGAYHGAAGSDHQITADDASTPATAVALANELKAEYEAHRAETDVLYTLALEIQTDLLAHMADVQCHMAADTTNNDFTQLSANTLAAIITTLNSIKAKYNSHDGESGTFHCAAGTAAQTSSADATDYASAITLANELKANLNNHYGYTTGIYSLLSDLRTQYIAHCAMGDGTHTTADVVNNGVIALSSGFSNLCAFANDLKSKYNAHDVETGTYHTAAGTDHQISSADATTWATLKALANELKSDYTDHIADAVAHTVADVTNAVTADNAADELHLVADLINAIATDNASAGLHLTADATNTIAEDNAGSTLQTDELLTDETSGATATSSTTAIDVWTLAYPPALVQNVINNSNADLDIDGPSVTLASGHVRVDLANSELETLLSDGYTSLKATYLKDAQASVTSGDGGAISAAPAAEITAGTNLSTLTDIPYFAWGY